MDMARRQFNKITGAQCFGVVEKNEDLQLVIIGDLRAVSAEWWLSMGSGSSMERQVEDGVVAC